MQSGEGVKPTPQFETAEFQEKPGTNSCFVCKQPISGSYYRINNRMACIPCAERLRSSVPKDSHAAFVRAMIFGAGGAVAGLALYSFVTILTGWMIGYVSLAVGWLVAKAMMKGSGGFGGRRYQTAAVLFTYAAVSLAAIPVGISQLVKMKKETAAVRTEAQPSAGAPGQPSPEPDPGQPANESKTSMSIHWSAALGTLALMGLASPFLELGSDPFHALIGLVILAVGIRIAWQIAAGRPQLVFDGPF